VLGREGKLARFITSGISNRSRDRIDQYPEGKGVLGVVLFEGKPLRVEDLAKHPRSIGFPHHHPEMKSFLGLPIVFEGRVLGDLFLTDKVGAECFSKDDETLAVLFAAQAAVAIVNARLIENEARRLAQLDGLSRVGSELSGIFDPERLLETVAGLLHTGFGYQSVRVIWVEQGGASIKLRALAGLAQGKIPSGKTWPATEGLAGWAVINNETVLCDDVSRDSRFLSMPGVEVAAMLTVPVAVKGEVVGVISVHDVETHAFDGSDVKTLETLADHLAVAIENLQLSRQQQEHSRRLAVVEERNRIGRDLHDGVIQSIYAAGLTLEDIAIQGGEGLGEAGGRIGGVVDDLNMVIRDIRSYIMDLCPRELQGRPLDEALNLLVKDLEDRTRVDVTLESGIDLTDLSEPYTVNLWHIFQEAFSNIEKYARATKVKVSLGTSGCCLDLEIADDGAGFHVEKAEMGRGYGLSNIKDRAERLGGALEVDSSPGRGTKLRVRLCLDGAGRLLDGD
jgi:signal transduction histidine kinase